MVGIRIRLEYTKLAVGSVAICFCTVGFAAGGTRACVSACTFHVLISLVSFRNGRVIC